LVGLSREDRSSAAGALDSVAEGVRVREEACTLLLSSELVLLDQVKEESDPPSNQEKHFYA
jgi:hypothetical protein